MPEHEPLYHGTRVPFGRGGLVLGHDETDAEPNHDASTYRPGVYVTPDLELAWIYADACKGDCPPRVLEVVPLDGLHIDDSTIDGDEQESYWCTAATVRRVLRARRTPPLPAAR